MPHRVHTIRRAQAYPPRAGGTMRNRVVLTPEDTAHADPLLALVEDWVRSPGGFPDHPHRGFETVTLVLEGELAHTDSGDHRSVLRPGDVQWMTAAHGVVHSEMPHGSAECHMLQLWVNLPAARKLSQPRYQDLRASDIPTLRGSGYTVRVISGKQQGMSGPAENVVPVLYLDVQAEPGAEPVLEVPAGYRGLVYVVEGGLELEGRPVRGGEVALLGEGQGAEGERLTARVTAPTRAVLVAGRPLGEPVVAHGPFVMNTEAEIAQAFQDYRAGLFA